MCNMYYTLIPKACDNKIHMQIIRVGFEPITIALLEQMSYH